MTSQPRPVWLTEDEMLLLPMWVRQQWVHAPADAAEAARVALRKAAAAASRQGRICGYTEAGRAVVGALGCPRTEQA